ncbi:MAG: FecR family protein [Chromatiales bacterium]
MKPSAWILSLLLLSLGALHPSTVVAATSEVGEVAQLKGQAARFADDGIAYPLSAGDAVHLNDRIETRSRSVVTIRFKDNTTFSLGPDSSFAIAGFRYAQGQDDSIAMRVVRGAFRFTTGLIARARASSMRVEAGAVATIGIRGTTVGGEVVGESATIVLLEPEEAGTSSAIEVANAYGSVVIDEPGWGTTVPDAHSPPTPPQRMRLRAIDNLIRSIQSIQRISVPRP